MVRQKESSLFKDIIGGLDFNKYHFPEFNPSFVHFNETVGDGTCYDGICGDFDGYLRESCCYDYEVAKNTTLVRRIMEDAKKEEVIQSILNNTLPTIKGGVNQTKSVNQGESETFES